MRKLRLALVLTFLMLPTGVCATERHFLSGYIGTIPSAQRDRARTYFDRPDVRQLLATLESGPIQTGRAITILDGTKVGDLERMHLVREKGGVLYIDFPYFTATDVKAIRVVAARHIPDLVADFRNNASRSAEIFSRYPIASVDRKRLAFVLIAGFSLNWDALDFLAGNGYRVPVLISGPGWHYGFYASEDVPGYSYEGYYWGSSSFPAGDINLKPPLDFTFSSFGDALNDPRMNFPDLLELPEDQMTPTVRLAAQSLGLVDDNELGLNLRSVIGLSKSRSLGTILFAVRDGAEQQEDICAKVAPAGKADCPAMLRLLVASGYLQTSASRYVLAVPVFGENDQTLLRSALRLNRTIIEEWLRRNYLPMRSELANLTALRQGVPYPALFSQIWHELFGLATRSLVTDGVIENPSETLWRGSIPVVWRTALYHRDWQ